MRVLASSDWHLSPSTAPLVWETIRQLHEAAATTKADALVIAGDLLEQARSLDGGLLLTLWRALRSLPCEVYVIQGNHDQIVLGDWASSPLSLLAGGNVRVIDRPTWTDLGLMVPYSDPRDWCRIVLDIMPTEPKNIPQVIWAHQGFHGAYQNRLRRDRDGLAQPGGLRTTITGHYHMPQNLGPLIYCGSPYQTSHAESGQAKSFLYYESLSAKLAFPIPARVAFDQIGPRYWTLTWDPAAEPPPTLPEGHRAGDVVRLILDGTRADARSHAAALRTAGLETVTIVARPAARAVKAAPIEKSDAGTPGVVASYTVGLLGPTEKGPDPYDVIEFAMEHNLWPV